MKEFYKCPDCGNKLSRQSLSCTGQAESTVRFYCRECNEYFVKETASDATGVAMMVKTVSSFGSTSEYI